MKKSFTEEIIQNPLKSFMRTLFLNFDFCNMFAKIFGEGELLIFWLKIGHGSCLMQILHIFAYFYI